MTNFRPPFAMLFLIICRDGDDMYLAEEWANIPGYEYHQVSNYGRVRSLDMPIAGGNGCVHHIKKGQIRKPMDNGHGYKWVKLSLSGSPIYVHRLVMDVFSPARAPEMTDVNHKDGNKANNRLDNLEWCTRSENMIHAYRQGLSASGESRTQAKLSFSDVCEIRSRYLTGETQQAIADQYGVSRQLVGKIVRGERRLAS